MVKSLELRKRFEVVVNHKRINRICRENGLLARNRRRKFPKWYYKQQKENKKNLPNNILDRNFTCEEPLKKLCTDVSFFRTTSGWLYLSPVLDLSNNKIICHVISRYNNEDLARDTLDMLFANNELRGSILHSDQGALYTSKKYRNRLREQGIIQSMSRVGNCWDNACMEHFFGTLKVESGYDDLFTFSDGSYQMVVGKCYPQSVIDAIQKAGINIKKHLKFSLKVYLKNKLNIYGINI